MTEVTDADIELVEAITEAWSDYQDLWFKSGRRKDACQRYWDAQELAARHREAAEAPLRAEIARLVAERDAAREELARWKKTYFMPPPAP
jgi:peptidyl-tRNA hydrolase